MRLFKEVPDPWVYFPACVMMALLFIAFAIVSYAGQHPHFIWEHLSAMKFLGGVFTLNTGILILGSIRLSDRQNKQRLAQAGQRTRPDS